MTKGFNSTMYHDPTQDLFLINELISASTKVTKHDDLINLIKDYSNKFFKCDAKGVWLFDERDQKLKLYYADGFDEEEKKKAERTVMDRHPGYVFKTGKTLWTHDQLTTKNKYSVSSKRKIQMRSRLCIPIGLGNKIIGSFGLASSQPKAFTKKDFALLQILNTALFNAYSTVIANEKITRNTDTIEMLRLLADNTSNLLIITDESGAITWVNKGFEIRTEYQLAEIIGKKPGSFLTGKNTDPSAMKILRQAHIKGTSAATKIIYYSRSGKEYISSIQINPFHNKYGVLMGFVSIQQDITQEEKNNQEIKHAFQKIKELSRFPLENPSPVFRFSKKDLRLLFANPVGRKVIKENSGDLGLIKKWMDCLALCQQKKQNFQFQIDTNTTSYSCSVVYVSDEKYFNIYGTDITELVGKQNKVIAMANEMARQKNFFEELFDNIPVDIAVFNRNHQYLYLNKEAIRDDEFRNWMVGKDDFDYAKRKNLPPEFAQKRRDHFLKLINNQVQEPWIDKQISQSGTYRYKDRRYHTYGDGNTIVGYGVDITDLKTTKNELEENYLKVQFLQTRYSKILQHTHDIIFTVDQNGLLTFVNHVWDLKTGYTEQESIGSNIFSCIHPDYQEHCMRTLARFKAGAESIKVNYKLIAKSGAAIECEGTANASFENGILTEIRQYLTDVTEVNKAKLVTETQRTKLIRHNVLLSKLSSKDFSKFNSFSLAIQEITRLVSQGTQIYSICIWDYVDNYFSQVGSCNHFSNNRKKRVQLHESDCPLFFKAVRDHLHIEANQHTNAKIAEELAKINGSTVQEIAILTIPIKINNNLKGLIQFQSPVDNTSWTAEDIAFARSIADIVLLCREVLKKKEVDLTFSLLFEKSTEPIMLISEAGSILECNESAVSILSVPAKTNLIGKKVYDFAPDTQPDGEYSREKYLSTNKTATRKGFSQFEWTARKANDLIIQVEVMVTKISLNGQTFFHTAWRDITLRKKAEDDLLSKNNLLEIRNNELQQFAYIASHDLQEPIGTMTMSAKLLLGNLVNHDNEQFGNQVKYIDFIMKSSQRMQDLVSGLLSYSRIGYNREVEKVDCTEIVNDVVSDLSGRIIISNATIHIGDLPILECYPLEMRMLFQNLISNALKFTKPGVPPEINISCVEVKKYWEFTIKDNGIGINKKHFDKIFVIFKRLHTREEYEGTGIGLAHCMKIALLHEGSLWVESIEGEGSEFNFRISKNLAYGNQNK